MFVESCLLSWVTNPSKTRPTLAPREAGDRFTKCLKLKIFVSYIRFS